MKHEETYGKMEETCRELPPGRFLSHLVTSFQAASYVSWFTHEWLPTMPYEQIIIAVPFFNGFLKLMVSYAKFVLVAAWPTKYTAVYVTFEGQSKRPVFQKNAAN